MRLELTRRGDYAVRAAVALASSDHDGLLSARRIAAEMRIPPRFLPQVMADLVHAQLVVAHTGRAGGYRLARPSAEISLLDVIRAAEHEPEIRACILRGGPCNAAGHCDVHDVFTGARNALLQSLSHATLAEVAEERRARIAAEQATAADEAGEAGEAVAAGEDREPVAATRDGEAAETPTAATTPDGEAAETPTAATSPAG